MAERDRTVEVPPERLTGWLERFAARHGDLTWGVVDGDAAAVATDGAGARFRLPQPGERPPPDGSALVAAATSLRDYGVVLVRRGGFAVGMVTDGALVASRCGTRYVQGRTKAGGWSQQRYARRRANQADELTDAAACAVHDVLDPSSRQVPLVCGGDRRLASAVLEAAGDDLMERMLAHWLDVPDPRRRVLEDAVPRARSVRVALNSLA